MNSKSVTVTLQSFRTVWRYGSFDPATGRFTYLPIWTALVKAPRWQGWYAELGGELAVLYVQEQSLWFFSKGTHMQLGSTASATLKQHGRWQVLELQQRDAHIRLEYLKSRRWSPSYDVTAGAEDEHFDFGLFICNVVNNRTKRDVIIQTTEQRLHND
jgi:hypothetical protein